MAVPKKRTGASAQGHRRSNWKASKPETTKCTNCGELVLTHTVCTSCGFYKNQPVRLKDKAELPVEAKPAKKAKVKVTKEKKTTKKVEVEEVKVETETEVVVEEVKEEKTEETTEE